MRPALAARRHERRVMLAPRVQQEPSAGFHDRTHFVLSQQLARAPQLVGMIECVRIEQMVIERQRDAAVTMLRQQLQRCRQAVVRESTTVPAALEVAKAL